MITYLQREIRHQLRNIGALKLSNLLQPDRFEEDLNIARVRLHPPSPSPKPTPPPAHRSLSAQEAEARRQRCPEQIRQFRNASDGRSHARDPRNSPPPTSLRRDDLATISTD